jgi:hypothetical protein
MASCQLYVRRHAAMVESQSMRRSLWLAIVVGWFAQLALVELLPVLAQVAGRIAAGEGGDSWAEHTSQAGELGWYIAQGVVVIASVVAGMLAGYLTPRRPVLVCVALVLLSLLGTFFQQLPTPRTAGIVALWVLGPCFGLAVGVAVSWRFRQNAV